MMTDNVNIDLRKTIYVKTLYKCIVYFKINDNSPRNTTSYKYNYYKTS